MWCFLLHMCWIYSKRASFQCLRIHQKSISSLHWCEDWGSRCHGLLTRFVRIVLKYFSCGLKVNSSQCSLEYQWCGKSPKLSWRLIFLFGELDSVFTSLPDLDQDDDTMNTAEAMTEEVAVFIICIWEIFRLQKWSFFHKVSWMTWLES